MSRLVCSFILFACFATGLAADTSDDQPIGGFVPKRIPAYIALVLFGISAIIHWIHFFTVKPTRRFLISLPLGMTAMAIGFALRIVYTYPPFTLVRYIAWDLFILLSPCAFLAGLYMLIGRLVAIFDQEVTDRCLLIHSSRIVKFFVWSDFWTFNLQGNGGGLAASKNATLSKVGNWIALVGLIFQALSFLFFTCVLLIFGWRVRAHFPAAWRPQNPRPFKVLSRQPIDDWRILFYVMCATSVGILIRSIFRVAEFAGGATGSIATHEGYFYTFDSLPLWLAMTLYCVVWPARALNEHSGQMELQALHKVLV